MTDPHAEGRKKYWSYSTPLREDLFSWPSLTAENCRHPAIEIGAMVHRETTIGIATGTFDETASRRSGGERHEVKVEQGLVWLSGAGLTLDEGRCSGPVDMLHLHIADTHFERLSEVFGGAPVRSSSIGFISGVRDDLIYHIGQQFVGEMTGETSAGRVLVDALVLSLTARLAQAYSVTQGRGPKMMCSSLGLDDARLERVLDYMRAHLEDDIGLDDMASIAALSPFHFSRMFHASMGLPPHRYLSRLRLERAKNSLARRELPLVDIALAARFSTQANFTRAFRAATGVTPGEYRRRAR